MAQGESVLCGEASHILLNVFPGIMRWDGLRDVATQGMDEQCVHNICWNGQ